MFNGIWLVAVEPLTIQGRTVPAGERFHVSRVHSGALLVSGRATIAQPQPPPKARVAETQAPPAPRRRGRRKKDEADVPSAPDVPAAPDVPPPPVVPDPPITPDPPESPDNPEAVDGQTRTYHRRDLEAEP